MTSAVNPCGVALSPGFEHDERKRVEGGIRETEHAEADDHVEGLYPRRFFQDRLDLFAHLVSPLLARQRLGAAH